MLLMTDLYWYILVSLVFEDWCLVLGDWCLMLGDWCLVVSDWFSQGTYSVLWNSNHVICMSDSWLF